MTACPRPEKNRYATREGAERRGDRAELRIDVRLFPYLCICGWWHLTKNPTGSIPTHIPARPEDVARLRGLPADEFTHLVSQDAKSHLNLGDRLALRHPDNLTRWRFALKGLRTDVTRRLATHRDTSTSHAADWRNRAENYRDAITLRIAECQTLRTQATQRRTAA